MQNQKGIVGTSREVLLDILKKYSYKKGEFTLASGKKSDFFIDCKKTTLSGLGHKLCGRVLFDEIMSLPNASRISFVSAVPLGACPLASAVVMKAIEYHHFLNVIYVRQVQKDHGTMQRVETSGVDSLFLGHDVVLLEDVVTTGGSSLKVARVLREAGYSVVCVLALVDREEGAKKILGSEGIELRSIYKRGDFIMETK